MKSHLISQVILKQFANDQRQIIVHTKDSSKTELKPINCVAYLDVDETLIQHLEEKWSHGVEDDAERAINALKNNNLVVVEKHIKSVKELIALHLIRSRAFHLVELNKHIIDGMFQQTKEAYSAAYPEYVESINKVTEAEYKKAPHDVAVKIMEKYIPMVEAYIADPNIGFEIGEAPDGSGFILGDIPVVTADKNGNFGIPITEANYIAMPLTPKYIVALKKNPDTKKYRKLSAKEVETANSRQLGLMLQHYYSSPS